MVKRMRYSWLTPPPGRKMLVDWCYAKHGRQIMLARTLGISAPAVSRWVRGRVRPPERFWPGIQELTGIAPDEWRMVV